MNLITAEDVIDDPFHGKNSELPSISKSKTGNTDSEWITVTKKK